MIKRLKFLLAILVALIPGVAYFAGRRSAFKETEREVDEDYIATRKDIDEVLRTNDADIARERLRERGGHL